MKKVTEDKRVERAKYEATIEELNSKLEAFEKMNSEISAELERTKKDKLKLRSELDETHKKLDSLQNAKNSSTSEPASDGGNDFPAFVKLKRENAILKAQLKDLMITQKKVLGSAKRVNMHGGRRR